MVRGRGMIWPAVVLAVLAACADTPTGVQVPVPGDTIPTDTVPDGDGVLDVRLAQVATGLTAPLLVTAPAGDPRLFIVQQDGRVLVMKDGQILGTPFLDLRPQVNFIGESGLLGLAFHPDYAENGYVFVNYTGGEKTHVVRYRVSSDPDRADAASAQDVLLVDQPFQNHNGGHMEFLPDGTLLIALGDGGSGGDPQGNGQNRATLLGSLLRIDVDALPYTIPQDNPFRSTPGARAEIWAYGLRNPWRFAVDAAGGRLYIADVGQDRLEEVDVAPLDAAGANYGWNIMEGTSCYEASTCSMQGLTLPVVEYDHGDGCSITGGRVYRGTALPGLVGHYLYSDFCAGWIRSFLMTDSGPTLEQEWSIPDFGRPTSFGQDGQGELYVTALGSGGVGRVFRIEPR